MDVQCFKTKGFSMEKAEKLAYLANLAYDHEEIWKAQGFEHVMSFDKRGAQAYGAIQDDIIFLAFRGTEPSEVNDIAADLKAWHREAVLHGSVHAGFADEIDKLWFDIRFWLKEYAEYDPDHEDKGYNKRIYVTGHSLGAAMATIATSRLPHDTVCYNFGSPRVGDSEFADRFDTIYECHRFVNNNDAVCQVPLYAMGFRHIGNLHYINTYGFIRKMTKWQRWKDRWRGRWFALKKWQAFDGFYDHSMGLYVRNLGRSVREMLQKV